jgi:RNA polymerase sigma factor (sigma-70 family)
MTLSTASAVVDHLRRVVLVRDGNGLPDGQLLESFLARQDGAAFATLVNRHGPMVMGVCRRILGNPHDAEDAFQATFLVLARKADGVVPREMVGNWLHGVAYRAAAKLRAANARRRTREKQVTTMPETAAPRHKSEWTELRPLLDHELSLLPDNYRAAVVLCDLEGKTGKEAARQLGWPEGSLASRLARGRKLLARRLTRRGVALSGGALAALLGRGGASAAVPESVASAAASHAAGPASARVISLAEGVIQAMTLTKLKTVTGTLLAIGAVALTCGALAGGPTDLAEPDAHRVALAAADGERPRADKQPEMQDGFITRPGEYSLYGGKLFVRVWEEEGKYRWNVTFPAAFGDQKPTLGPAKAQLRPGSAWFLFPVSADVVWAYEPDAKRMTLMKRRSPDDFVMKDSNLPAGWQHLLDVESPVPAKLLKRLPRELRPAAKAEK